MLRRLSVNSKGQELRPLGSWFITVDPEGFVHQLVHDVSKSLFGTSERCDLIRMEPFVGVGPAGRWTRRGAIGNRRRALLLAPEASSPAASSLSGSGERDGSRCCRLPMCRSSRPGPYGPWRFIVGVRTRAATRISARPGSGIVSVPSLAPTWQHRPADEDGVGDRELRLVEGSARTCFPCRPPRLRPPRLRA